MEFVSELPLTVILSSHLLSDLERICDHLILITDHHIQLNGDVDDLLATHFRLTTTPDNPHLPHDLDIITTDHTTLTARRGPTPIPHTIETQRLDLEDLVLAYMTRAANPTNDVLTRPHTMEAQR
jgi:ABC-2 type transport system ATP-binding protein